MKKCLKLSIALMLVCTLVLALGSCEWIGSWFEPDPGPGPGPGVDPEDPVAHSITVQENIQHGTVSVDKATALSGETVTVTATPDDNYVLVGITANGTPVENGSFVMGDEDVVVSASFKLSDEFEINAGVEGGTVITAPSMGGGNAKAQIFTVFGENGIEFTAYVEDAGISDKDGIAILFSRVTPIINQLLPNGQTVKLAVYTDGTASVQKTDENGELVAAELAGCTISSKLWSKDGESQTGYIVRASVSYSALGLESAESAKGNVSICPVVYNAYGSVSAKSTALMDADESAHNTFPVLKDDNSYEANPFENPAAQLGSAGNIVAGDFWDLSKDYYAADTENYPNRVAILNGHDGMDNNLVFYGVSANEMYVEATIKVTGVANANDQWPKFGLMLFNGGGQSGLFYYVDAAMNQATDNTTANIVGTALGYNKGIGEWKQWTNVKNNAFDLTTLTITLQMVYQNGWVHLYANDTFVQSIYVGAYNEDMHFGFKSFGLNLEVTDYFASEDAEADGWADKKIAPAEKAAIEVLFAGDSYMDFWKTRYQAAHLADYIATYANEGVGGTQVPYWIEKASEMALLYNPENIVFHIGVNDIDGGASPESTLADLKTLFETYHEMFPNAKIYWNGLIPNTMFASEVADYYAVNAGVKEYAAERDWLVYIDQAPTFELSEGVANPVYFDDGLHLSPDIGYPIWVKNMLTAMGYTRIDGTNAGDVDGFAHSGGYDFKEDGSLYLDKSNEMIVYFKDAKGDIIYVEAMVSIGTLYNNDGYPKFGLVAHGEGKSLWGFVDAAGYPANENKVGAFVERYINNTHGHDFYTGWDWSTGKGWGQFSGSYSNGEFVKLAIAKYGNTAYLFANDTLVASASIEGEVQIGFQVFNLEATVKNVTISRDEALIKDKIGLASDAVIDGKADDSIWTEEVLSNTITMGDKGDGRHFEAVAVKGSDGIYLLVTTYSNANTRQSANWWENANVEFRFGNDLGKQYYYLFTAPGFDTVAASAGITGVATAGGTELENGLWKATVEFFVPYKSIDGYDKNSAEIPVYLWGWVFDEGWFNGMNNGGYPLLTVSEHGLRYQRNVSVQGTNSAVSITAADKAYAGDTVSFTVATEAEIDSLTVTTKSGTAITFTEGESGYSFIMPDEDVTISVSLKGISVTSSGEHFTLNCEQGIVVPSETVRFTLTPAATYKVTSVKVNGEAVTADENGVYSYVVKSTDTAVVVTAETDYDTEGFAIDGTMSENYGEAISFLVEGNRSVSIWAIKGNNGLYFYVKAITNTLINDNAAEWWMNHNFEFQLNMSGQLYINSRNEGRGITRSVWESTQITEGDLSGKWQHVTEFFVHRDSIANFDSDTQLNFAFKAPGEATRYEGLSSNTWDITDWWTPSIATLDGNADHGYNMHGVSPWLKIRAEGLVNTKPVAQDATIDADLSEYEGKLDLYRGNANAYFHIMGFEGSDGVYLAFEIWQNNLAAPTTEWWLNDNLEIRVNNVNCGFSLFDNFIDPWGNVTSWAMKRVESDKEGYAHKTVVEMFIHFDNPTEHSYVWIGCNGNGFGGWQPLCWDDGIVWASADGLAIPTDAAINDGITVDGKADEACYAGKSSVTFTPNGATVVMTGTKLEHGASFIFDVTHARPVTDGTLQSAADAWANHLNFELYLGNNSPQIRASVINGGWGWWCALAYTTEQNADGTYHTVMEFYIPYGIAVPNDIHSDILLGLGAVVDGGYNWLAVWDNNLYLTDNGVAYK